MKTYLCLGDTCENQVLAGVNRCLSDSVDPGLQASQDRRSCDVIFVQERHLTPDLLSGYRFTQLLEVDQNFSDRAIVPLLQSTPGSLLSFNVSSFCAYHQRLAKLFITQLGLQAERLQLQDETSYDLPLHEAITNATIHGNLELSSSFTDLESMGQFYESVSQRLSDAKYAGRRVVVEASSRGGQILIAVRDEGQGHDLQAGSDGRHDQLHGRGFALISGNSEGLEFEDEGRTSKIAFRV